MPVTLRTPRWLRRGTARGGFAAVAIAASVVAVTATSSVAAPTPSAAPGSTADRACRTPAPGHAACLAMVNVDATGHPLTRQAAAAANKDPFTAADLQDAYKLPSEQLGARQTIAIVVAYDNPRAEADLAIYRAENGLPACDADFPCLRKVDQRGGSTLPPANAGWGLQIAVDLAMASAACPNCTLVLVEADDSSLTNLVQAVDTAANLGADVVLASWGAPEFNDQMSVFGDHFDHPGTTIVAPAGDTGFGAVVPAALPTVVAVGGTSLFPDASSPRGWTESAWQLTGSGCSAYVPKPSWQKDRLCAKRTVADVSAVADPNTPVAVYDSFGFPGWILVGGTSVAASFVAGVFALAGNASTINPGGAYLAAHRSGLFDVTSGSNGFCGGGYLCTAVAGYDGPTGFGTPNGIGAF